MIAEAIDAALTLGWWLAAWIAVLAFVGAVLLLAGLACGTWAVKRAWRALRGPHTVRDGLHATTVLRDTHTPASTHTAPAWAHTDKEAA